MFVVEVGCPCLLSFCGQPKHFQPWSTHHHVPKESAHAQYDEKFTNDRFLVAFNRRTKMQSLLVNIPDVRTRPSLWQRRVPSYLRVCLSSRKPHFSVR